MFCYDTVIFGFLLRFWITSDVCLVWCLFPCVWELHFADFCLGLAFWVFECGFVLCL